MKNHLKIGHVYRIVTPGRRVIEGKVNDISLAGYWLDGHGLLGRALVYNSAITEIRR